MQILGVVRSGFPRLLMAAVWMWIPGCTGGDGFSGPRGEVQGTITYQDSPVPAGSIVRFQSTDEGATYVAVGTVQEEGKYQLTYAGSRQIPGVTYTVQITPPPVQAEAQEPVDATDPDPDATDPQKMIEAAKAAAEDNPPPFPVKYGSFETSGLTFTVEAGLNVADFELEDE